MLCELYSPSIAMPEAPKQSFFTKLFTSNSVIDSDQLCMIYWKIWFDENCLLFLVGEAAGKAPFGVVKREDVNANMNQMRGKVDSATSVVNDTRMVSSIKNSMLISRFLIFFRNCLNVVKS